LIYTSLSFTPPAPPRLPPPFPTRRSSDLGDPAVGLQHLSNRHGAGALAIHAQGHRLGPHGEMMRGLGRERPAEIAQGFGADLGQDRKSTRLNSSHLVISYAVFCLKKKKKL